MSKKKYNLRMPFSVEIVYQLGCRKIGIYFYNVYNQAEVLIVLS